MDVDDPLGPEERVDDLVAVLDAVGAERAITVEMQRPKAQVSTYVDNGEKAADRKPGIQEPIRPKKGVITPSNTATSPQNK